MHTILLIFLGVITAQLLYIAANWWQYRRSDYAWYFLYLFILLHYFLIIGSDDIFGADMNTGHWKVLLQGIRFLAFAGYAVYFLFIKSFLQTRQREPVLHRGISIVEKVLWVLSGIYLVWEQALGRTPLSSTFYFICSIALFACIVWLIARLWRKNDALSLYILRGAIMLALGAFGTNLIIIYFQLDGLTPPNIYLLPLMAGILVEILFFNNGLSYKSHSTERQLIASQQQLIDELRQKEQLQQNLNNMRQRISRDLHDDLGSALSGIRLLAESQLARPGNDAGIQTNLMKISGTAKELGSRISEIIWAGNEAKNNTESLLLFVRQYALEYLEQAGIECHCLLPSQIPHHIIDGEKRRHIFLAIKEALHNVAKHADARKVTVSFEIDGEQLAVTIHDDGKGFDPATLKRQGNGLTNMRHRIEHETGGSFQISSTPAGTTIKLSAPIGQAGNTSSIEA